MTVQLPTTVVTFVPHPVRVMAEEDLLAIDVDHGYIFDPTEAVTVLINIFIVISSDEEDVSIEAAANVSSVSLPTTIQRKVTDVINGVGSVDCGVPVDYQRLIHRCGRFEWAVTITQNICVRKMRICCEKGFRHGFLIGMFHLETRLLLSLREILQVCLSFHVPHDVQNVRHTDVGFPLYCQYAHS